VESTIFVSYARDEFDIIVRQKLQVLLRTLADYHGFELFVDETGIEPGFEITMTVRDAIDRCDVAVLLVSPGFCDSTRYVQQVEYPALLVRQQQGLTRLLPVLVSKAPCICSMGSGTRNSSTTRSIPCPLPTATRHWVTRCTTSTNRSKP